MIGRIEIVLFSIIFCGRFLSEAQSPPLPVFNPNVASDCSSYTTKANYSVAVGNAYAVAYSGAHLRCITVNIQPIVSGGQTVGYTSTIYYYQPSDTNQTNLITSPTNTVIENPNKPGEVQSYRLLSNGTYQLIRTTEVVGYIAGDPTSPGYALAACSPDGAKEVSIFVRNTPPQSDDETTLKNQLPDNNLQNITLNEVYQGSDCHYFTPS